VKHNGIDIDDLESRRITLQRELDAQKAAEERNRLGQFSTPPNLAEEILTYAKMLLPADSKVRFLDPAIGTGAFYSALLRVFGQSRIAGAAGYEIDPHYAKPAIELWKHSRLALELADFTRAAPSSDFNLVICNPPYVRHHHVPSEEKSRLQLRTLRASGSRLSGLAGLYCHFIGLSQAWMAKNAIAGWLIPSEFMDVNYGRAVKQYLLQQVTLLEIHRFNPNDVQFSDALVSSAVVWFRNALPPDNHSVKFSFGGTLLQPKSSKIIPSEALMHEAKWTRFPGNDVRQKSTAPIVADFFRIKRGIATGSNESFILSADELAKRELPVECFKPILPSPRHLPCNEITADKKGNPLLERRMFLLDPNLSEGEIKSRFPNLWSYLEELKAKGLDKRYLCRHRSPWYSQENRPPAPIVCTYLGRSDKKDGRPFRFILNHSAATVANVYLAMYPTPSLERAASANPDLMRQIWKILNRIHPDELLGEGRVYGGGLHKLEPRELAQVPIRELGDLVTLPPKQAELFAVGEV